MADIDERRPLLNPSTPASGELSKSRKRVLIITTLITGFLSSLDLTIVATCIPTISSELQAADREAWIGTAYLWSNVTFTPLYGRLSDLIGRRAAYLQAILLFTFGTILCGCAPNFTTLVIARFTAGMGGGGMGTVASVLTGEHFAPADRSFYQGLGFAVFGLGMGLGGPIGGWLTQYFGWRAAFYFPVAFITVFLVLFVVPQHTHQGSIKNTLSELDFGGSITLLLSIGALLQLLSRSGQDIPLSKDTFGIIMAISFPIFFLAFIYVELKVASKPVLPLSLLTRRTPLCVGIIAGVIAIVNFNMIYHLPTMFEIVFQQSLSKSGSHLLPNSIAMTLSAPIVGLVVKKTLRYKWAGVICCLGPVIAMTLLANLDEHSSKATQWLAVVPMGAGFSGLLILTLTAMLNSVEKSEIATATGFVFVFRSIGQVFGVGLSSAVYQYSLSKELNRRISDEKVIDRLRHASKAIKKLPPKTQDLARAAFRIALRNTFLFGLVGAILVLITALLIRDEKLHDPTEKAKVVSNDEEDA